MNQGVRTIFYPIKDMTQAKLRFSTLLGVEPYADQPYYVGFKVGNQDIGLVTNGQDTGMTAFYHVDDIQLNLQSLRDAGARYATLGFSDKANLVEGAMWPVAVALKELTHAEEARIAALVTKAVSW